MSRVTTALEAMTKIEIVNSTNGWSIFQGKPAVSKENHKISSIYHWQNILTSAAEEYQIKKKGQTTHIYNAFLLKRWSKKVNQEHIAYSNQIWKISKWCLKLVNWNNARQSIHIRGTEWWWLWKRIYTYHKPYIIQKWIISILAMIW
jgi:hypothetical protein